jgi:small-conductance mechanosensitive channel
LLEAAHEAIRDGLQGLLAKPEPSVSFIPGFGQSSLDFSLGLQLSQLTDQYRVQSELRKRIVKKFQEAGIHMPFPTRTLILDKSTKDLLSGGSQS